MKIEEAFTQEAINTLELTDEDTEEMVQAVARVGIDGEMNLDEDLVQFAALCFAAGRAYQFSEPVVVQVDMNVEEYVQYLRWQAGEHS